MAMDIQAREGRAGSSRGSTTPTATATTLLDSHRPRTLRLRAQSNTRDDEQRQARRHVQWAEDVVNNEGMGRKRSKVCCIYHKPRRPDESSSDESSSSSGDETDSDDDGAARPSSSRKPQAHERHGHNHHHGSNDGHGHEHSHDATGHSCDHGSHGASKGKAKRRSPNAYESVPHTKEAKPSEL